MVIDIRSGIASGRNGTGREVDSKGYVGTFCSYGNVLYPILSDGYRGIFSRQNFPNLTLNIFAFFRVPYDNKTYY